MTSITSAGIGSGLDVASLVSQLVSADRTPEDNRLNSAQSRLKLQLSAFNAISGTMKNLDTALSSLQGTSSAFLARTAASSDTTVFTATATSSAVAGHYRVEVQSLATQHKLASAGFPAETSAIGTGTLTIGVGGNTFNIDVDGTNGTPAGIRDAINAAAGNTGVTASLITADDGVHLVLTAKDTGTTHAITVTSSGGDGGLAALAYDPGNGTTALSQLTEAKDAVVAVEGFTYTSASNEVSGSIPGVTLDLVSAKPGTTLDLTVANDNGGASNAIASFVSAYNAVVNVLRATTAYDATTKTASALTGDALARAAGAQLRNALSASLGSGSVKSLLDLGITTQTDGTIALDNDKLDAALAADPSAVAKLFSSDSAVGSAMSSALDNFVKSDGVFDSRTGSINRQLDDISKQRDALDRRMASAEARYKAQFTALDSLMSQMSATSTFLTNQFSKSSSSS